MLSRKVQNESGNSGAKCGNIAAVSARTCGKQVQRCTRGLRGIYYSTVFQRPSTRRYMLRHAATRRDTLRHDATRRNTL